jgi:hypothetical protein
MKTTANQRLTVYVNDEPRRFFVGLRVRHAVGYSAAWRVERREAIVKDRDGNQIDLDGALYDGERLYVEQIDTPESNGGD